MDQRSLEHTLKPCRLGAIRHYASIGSTNDEALAWAASNAPDLALVVADEQTSGRGRAGRSWASQPGASLTFSLILRPPAGSGSEVSRTTFLGALALASLLRGHYNLPAQIKWPNDVLIDGRKVCGILAEAVWRGAEPDSVVLGMGINLLPGSVPQGIPLNFPAACLADFTPTPPHPEQLLPQLIQEIVRLRPSLPTPSFMQELQALLAFKGQLVRLTGLGGNGDPADVRLDGLAEDGSLAVTEPATGRQLRVHQGEVHLLSATGK